MSKELQNMAKRYIARTCEIQPYAVDELSKSGINVVKLAEKIVEGTVTHKHVVDAVLGDKKDMENLIGYVQAKI